MTKITRVPLVNSLKIFMLQNRNFHKIDQRYPEPGFRYAILDFQPLAFGILENFEFNCSLSTHGTYNMLNSVWGSAQDPGDLDIQDIHKNQQ